MNFEKARGIKGRRGILRKDAYAERIKFCDVLDGGVVDAACAVGGCDEGEDGVVWPAM